MYVTLLLIAPAVCEWVEITQQHYQKPVGAHHFANVDWTGEDDDETTRKTHPQHHGKHGLHHSYNTDVVQNVDKTSSEISHYFTKKPTSAFSTIEKVKKEHAETSSEIVQHRHRKPVRTQYFPTHTVTESYEEESTSDIDLHHIKKPTSTYQYRAPEASEETMGTNIIYHNQSITGAHVWNKGNINKVPKIGNVQRVQLETNAIKAPTLRNKPVRNTTDVGNAKYLDKNQSDPEHLSLTDLKKTNRDIIFVTNTKETLHSPIRQTSTENHKDNIQFKNDWPRVEIERVNSKGSVFKGLTAEANRKSHKTTTVKPNNNVSLRTPSIFGYKMSTKSPLITDHTDIISHKRVHVNDGVITTSTKPTHITKRIDGPDRESGIPKRVFSKYIENKITNSDNQGPIEFITKNDHENVYATISEDSDEPTIVKVHQTHEDSGQSADQNNEEPSSDESADKNKEPSEDHKANTLEHLMTLMKVVADTIKANTRRSVNSKTRYLSKLKDTILANIKERIDSTWPDDPPETQAHSRMTRAAQATARGHLEIPSSESALMTISFLTFAVFLIKLVLQVIQKYKNKTMMVTPAVVATVGRAASTMKRSFKP